MSDLLGGWAVTLAGWLAAATLLTLYINVKSDIKAEIERCNTEKVAAIQEATDALRVAQQEAYEAQIAELRRFALQEAEARRIAQEAATEAQNRPERVRTVIREMAAEPESCLNTAIPSVVLDEMK